MSCKAFVPIAAVAFLGLVPAVAAHAQPLPTAGRVIEAADGDVVVVPRDAQVTVVTRSQVQARLVYVAAQQTLLLLTDPALEAGGRIPDVKGFRRWQMHAPWPLEARWEGSATIDEYAPSGRGPLTLAIHTDRGTILVGPLHARQESLAFSPVAVVHSMASSSRIARGSFDEIEQAWLAGGDNAVPGGRPVFGGAHLSATTSGAAVVPGGGPSPPAGAVRVGGNIRMPMRVKSAEPIYPQIARDAGLQGVVILELHLGTDGAVSNARVLRSIPVLDQAALDAARQWRYEPTLLNGVPVPVILTATVNFAP